MHLDPRGLPAPPRPALTRRFWIQAAAAVVALQLNSKVLAATGFWNRKDPSAWTSEEVLLLTTRSPWAKDTRVDRRPKGHGREGEQPDVQPSTDPTNGSFRGSGAASGRTQAKLPSVVVTWESAQPLIDALKYPISPEFANHYIIGVRDLPIIVEAGPRRQTQQELLDWLKNSATLRARMKDPVQAGVIVPAREGSTVLFGFLKELLPLTITDRDVLFTLDTDQVVVKARFDPRDMIYQGQLAL